MSADSGGRPIPRWPSYARHCRDPRPNALLVEAVSALGRSAGRALDIGAGTLRSSRYLLGAGFVVDAVDPDPYTGELAAAVRDPRLRLTCADIRDFRIAPRSYEIVVAIHVLHLIPRRDLAALMTSVVAGLTEDGVLCATFLGIHDSWALTPWRATVLTGDEVLALASGLDVVRLEEREYDGDDVLARLKHWHTVRCIFRKRSADPAA